MMKKIFDIAGSGRTAAARVLIALFLAAPWVGTAALDAELNLRYLPWSYYDEHAGDPSMVPERIWGDFDTASAQLSLGQRLFGSPVFLGLEGRGSLIMPNSMYIGAETSSLTIGGYILGFDARLGWRFADEPRLTAETGFGFSYLGGTKEFSDFTVDESVQKPGNFGDYAFSMFGPMAYFDLSFRSGDGRGSWSADLSLFGTPRYENHSLVSGWEDTPKEEYAEGWRAGGSASLSTYLNQARISAGIYADWLYFASGDLATHDLGIFSLGPFVSVSLAR